MRIKHLCTLGLRFAMLSFFAVLLPMGCSAKTIKKEKVKRATKIEIVDSTARKVVGDSVYTIMMNGKIKAMLVSADAKCSEIKLLTREDCHLLRFLVTDPNLYIGEFKVYGKMIPCIKFEFSKSKEETVFVSLDFGLGKWTINDAFGKVVYRSSISTYDLLRFCHDLYPESELITKLYNSTIK